MNPKNIIHLSPSDNFTKIYEGSKTNPLVLDFFATWCGPCKRLSPILEQAANKHKFTLCVIDVDQNKELARQYSVSSIPHVFLVIDKNVVMDFVGCNIGKVEEMIQIAKKKVNLFTGKGTTVGQAITASINRDATSIPDQPEEGDDVYSLCFRFNNRTFERRFKGNDTIGQVKAYVRKEVNAGNIQIFTLFPKTVYEKDNVIIMETDLAKRTMLNVTLV